MSAGRHGRVEEPSHAAHVEEGALRTRLAALSLEQKVRLLTGADIWALHAEPAIGLRRVVTSDGPAGVRGENWDERSPSANVPSPTALAATWDEGRVERIGRLLASEARRKGVDVLLAPTVNLHRTPYGGRHFECLSEDPLLTAGIGGAFVRGVQDGGVAATVKHFVANDSETDRFTVDVAVDERPLRELYLAPFEAIIRHGGAWAVMAAYNSLDGTTMTEHPLLGDVLKREWGFDGVVVSDWHAARSLAAAGEDLLDLVMPGPGGPWGDALLAAVRDGAILPSAIDGHVLRILRLAARVGALDGLPPARPVARTWTETEIAAELRSAAAAGFVLARNDGLLPLERGSLRAVAVIGPNAAVARTLGGGSATVFPPHVVSPLDGLRAALSPEAEVTDAPGCRTTARIPVAPPSALRRPDGGGDGVEVRFFAADGRELHREHRRVASWLWWGPIAAGVTAAEVDAVEVRTLLCADRDGAHRIGASGLGAVRLSIDGRTEIDATVALPEGADVVESMMRPPQVHAEVELTADRAVPVCVRYRPARHAGDGESDAGILTLQLNLAPPFDDDAEFAAAVARAEGADVAVVVVGTSEEVESEGFDRDDLRLPGRQNELVEAVAAVNPRTVVVVNSGAPVLLPWAERVAAVLLAWFPGQEFGHALADVLLGAAEPGGRLPTTWPRSADRHPAVTPRDGRLSYEEGLFIGYRAYDRDGRDPQFPFGHGLGYTDWVLRELAVPGEVRAGEDLAVAVTVENTGPRHGREVVQVYVAGPHTTVSRPVRALAGYVAVEAPPGDTVSAEIVLPARAFEHWEGGWASEPGPWTVQAGHSSRELPLQGTTVLAAGVA